MFTIIFSIFTNIYSVIVMKIRRTYSIAIYPPAEVMNLVKEFKDLLAKIIGWFHSRNSIAHITIIEFQASEAEILIIKDFLKRFCGNKSPFHINLDGFKNYLNGALFIAPDEESKLVTKSFMKQLQASFPLKYHFGSKDPHMSIARQLDKQHIEIANYLFKEVKAEFDCDTVVLREFNEDIKQFVVIEKYILNGSEGCSNNNGQLSLGFL